MKRRIFVAGTAMTLAVVAAGCGGQAASTNTSAQPVTQDGVQVVKIAAKEGYTPNQVEVVAGKPVKLVFVTNNTRDCSTELVIPKLGKRLSLKPTDEQSIEFTPKEAGTIPFACSMSMYSGKIIVKAA